MEIMPGLHLIEEVVMPGPEGDNPVNVGLLVEGDALTVVDAGPPGALRAIAAYVRRMGRHLSQIRRVIITHHHWDHTGSLGALVEATGAEVWAHTADASLIDGSEARPVVEMTCERIRALMPEATPEQINAFLERRKHVVPAPPARVDLRLTGGEELAVLGGCRIVHTPGHTPGHICLYLPERSLLIAGDMLRWDQGRLQGPPPLFTADPAAAAVSLRQLAELRFEAVYGYHGQFLPTGAGEKLHDLLAGS